MARFMAFLAKRDQVSVFIVPGHEQFAGHPINMVLSVMDHQIMLGTAKDATATVSGQHLRPSGYPEIMFQQSCVWRGRCRHGSVKLGGYGAV